MWENERYTQILPKDSVYRHERAVLTDGSCDRFLPVVFVQKENALLATFDCSGYLPLSRYRVEKTDDALYLIEKALRILHVSCEYMLSPERLTISTDTLFYDRKTGDLKLAFLPLPPERVGLRRNLILFLAQLKQDITDPYSGYLDRFAREIYFGNLSLPDMISVLGLLRRELDSQTSDVL